MANARKVERAPYEILIEGHFPRLRPSLKRCLTKAALATLEQIPQQPLRKLLKPHLPYQLAISTIGPKQMQRLNARFRGKDKTTDVLAFSTLEAKCSPNPSGNIGDVLICLAVAKQNAKVFKCTLENELQRLVVHGILHLFGYDHETSPQEARKMFRLQEKVLVAL